MMKRRTQTKVYAVSAAGIAPVAIHAKSMMVARQRFATAQGLMISDVWAVATNLEPEVINFGSEDL